MAGVTQAAMLFAVAEGHINDHEVAERRGFSRVDPPEKKREKTKINLISNHD